MDNQNQTNQLNNSQDPEQTPQVEDPKKANNLPKWVLVLIIVAVIVIFGLAVYVIYRYFNPQREQIKVPNTQEAVEENNKKDEASNYPDDYIFYTHDGQIWQFDSKTNTEKKIADSGSAVFSPNKTKVAYIVDTSSDYSKDLNNNLSGVYVFDTTINKGKLIWQKYYNKYPIIPSEVSWSLDGKYLVADVGTSPIRTKIVIDSENGQEIISFITYSRSYAWLNNNEITFSDIQEISEMRPYGDGRGSGVAVIDLNNQKRVLKTATTKEGYEFIQVLDGGKIYFSLTEVDSNDDWGDRKKQTISYWTMDKFGNNLNQVDKIEDL